MSDILARKSITLSPAALKRLVRLQARAEGASAVAQAAAAGAQQLQSALQQAFTEECQDEGLFLPVGGTAEADLDWRTGQVVLKDDAPPMNGMQPVNGELRAAV